VERQRLLEGLREGDDAVLAAFALIDADLAAVEVGPLQTLRLLPIPFW